MQISPTRRCEIWHFYMPNL